MKDKDKDDLDALLESVDLSTYALERVKQSADYEKQVVNNPDEQNRRLALEALINQAVLAQRKTDMQLYQLRQDEAFKQAFNETIMRILAVQQAKKSA